MKYKKASEMFWGAVIGLILLVVGFMVLLYAQSQGFNVLGGFGKKQACILNIEAMSLLKGSAGPGTQPWTPNCDIHRINVKVKDVESSSGKREMEARETKYNINWPSGYDYLNYNLDKIVAGEIKYAWDIVARGDREYFSEWWHFFRCTNDDPKSPTPSGTVACTEKPDQDWWKFWEKSHPSSVTMCMILSRVKFEPEINEEYSDKFAGNINTLMLWMNNNPVDDTTESNINPGTLMSYTEYLRTDNEGFSEEGDLLGPEFTYSTDQPYIVVYMEPKPHIVDVWKKPLEWIRFVEAEPEKPFNTVRLIKLSETTHYCDYIIGYSG